MTHEEFLKKLLASSDKIKSHRIEIFLSSQGNRIDGSYDRQPFLFDYEYDKFVVFGMRTLIDEYFNIFIEAISKMFDRKPLCTYEDKLVSLKICEWSFHNEDKRFEFLLTNNNKISNLKLYENNSC